MAISIRRGWLGDSLSSAPFGNSPDALRSLENRRRAARKRYYDSEVDLMIYAAQLKNKGREEGRNEGWIRGRFTEKQEVLIRLLSRKFGVTEAVAIRLVRLFRSAAEANRAL